MERALSSSHSPCVALRHHFDEREGGDGRPCRSSIPWPSSSSPSPPRTSSSRNASELRQEVNPPPFLCRSSATQGFPWIMGAWPSIFLGGFSLGPLRLFGLHELGFSRDLSSCSVGSDRVLCCCALQESILDEGRGPRKSWGAIRQPFGLPR